MTLTVFLVLVAVGSVVIALALVRRTRRLERELQALGRSGPPPSERAPSIHVPSLSAAVEDMPIGVVLLDAEGQQVFANDFAGSFLAGRHGEAVVARTIDELARSALAEGVDHDRQVQIYGPPRRTVDVSAHPIGPDGDLGVNVLIVDVTEQERINAIRRDFVANISHELRTPIGALSLLAETLVGETDHEVVALLAVRINGEAERLACTVNDLLQLSEIEHGSDDDFEPVRIQSVVASAADRVRSAAEQRSVDIGIVVPDRNLMVLGDPIQLNSAVYNLLDNAVKYIGADEGTISVRARRQHDRIELIVQDSGIGIPRRDLDRIFERFYRVDRGRSRERGGTGLGLSIVRHVVVNHGGTIDVTSTEGEGTTFTIELPALGPIDQDDAEFADETNT